MTEKVYFTVKETDVKDFKTYLYERENAETTISKYSTDLRCFFEVSWKQPGSGQGKASCI